MRDWRRDAARRRECGSANSRRAADRIWRRHLTPASLASPPVVMVAIFAGTRDTSSRRRRASPSNGKPTSRRTRCRNGFCPRQMMRHVPCRPIDLVDGLARIGRDVLARRRDAQFVVRTNGSVRYTGSSITEISVRMSPCRTKCSVTVRLVAARHAVAADPAHLQVRGRDGEHVAVPLAGRESLPGVRRVFRRMRTAVHPDRALGLPARRCACGSRRAAASP